ncbi:exosome non-catalytic core subunit rrp4, partial [Ascosphaera atra]
MPITILPPVVEDDPYISSEDEAQDSEGDVDMDLGGNKNRPSKRLRLSKGGVVTPGEVVTDDPQWM